MIEKKTTTVERDQQLKLHLNQEGEDMESVDESLVDSSSAQPASPWALGR